MKNLILITAKPRTGKSTLIKKIIEEMGSQNFCGFFTEEMRENGERVGFKIKELGGQEFVFSRIDLKSDYKISRYFVDLKKFEEFISSFFSKIDKNKILVIDEIGPMQILSPLFKQQITKLFNTPITVLGTIFYDNFEWLDEIKKSDKIEMINLTLENRDVIVPEITGKLTAIKKNIYDLNDEINRKEIKSNNYVNLFGAAIKNENGEIIINSEHDTRTIKADPILGYSCSCEFYKKANICSHILAYKKFKNLN